MLFIVRGYRSRNILIMFEEYYFSTARSTQVSESRNSQNERFVIIVESSLGVASVLIPSQRRSPPSLLLLLHHWPWRQSRPPAGWVCRCAPVSIAPLLPPRPLRLRLRLPPLAVSTPSFSSLGFPLRICISGLGLQHFGQDCIGRVAVLCWERCCVGSGVRVPNISVKIGCQHMEV